MLNASSMNPVFQLRSFELGSHVQQTRRDVLDGDVDVVGALPVGQPGMDLAGFGVDEECLQHLAVPGEQRVGQRAVTPEHAVPMQFHQKRGHRVEQPSAVFGRVRRQPHEQPPVLPRADEVARQQDRGVEVGLEAPGRQGGPR